MKRMKRVIMLFVALFTATALAIGGLFAAWLSGAHIPLASGATYLRVEKLAPISSVDKVGGGPSAPFFILLVGNDSRPGVGGARGDALHVLGVNPSLHQASMIDIPRDTCWNNDKINVGNTQGPRQQANDVGGLVGRPDLLRRRRRLRRLQRSGRRCRRRRRQRADADARLVLGRVLQPRHAAHERHSRRCRSRATATTSRRATSCARTTKDS